MDDDDIERVDEEEAARVWQRAARLQLEAALDDSRAELHFPGPEGPAASPASSWDRSPSRSRPGA